MSAFHGIRLLMLQYYLLITILVLFLLQKSRPYKEAVEIRHNTGSPRVRQRGVPPPPLKVLPQPDHLQKHQRPRQSNWNNGVTKITKFRKTVWGVFVVAHDFDPMDENEIAIRKGEHVSVWNQDDRDWFWVVKHASSGQEEGFVPSGCLREVSTDSKISIRCKFFSIIHTLSYWIVHCTHVPLEFQLEVIV